MDIDELRKQVSNESEESNLRWQATIGVLLAAALICSVATPFVEQLDWLPVAAIVFLALGLLGARSLQRRSLRS